MAKLKKETLEVIKKVGKNKTPTKKTMANETDDSGMFLQPYMRKLKWMPLPNMQKNDVSSTYVKPSNFELAKEPISKPIGEGTLNLEDNRKIRATTQKKINPKDDLVADSYDKNTIQYILDAAKRYNYDPYTALAVALQETNLGKKGENIGHTLYHSEKFPSKLKLGMESMNLDKKETDKIYAADNMVRMLLEKKNYAEDLGYDDELHHLQAYNGLGTVYPKTENWYHGYDMSKIYGVDLPKTGIDMNKNPLYGKQIIDLRENVIKKNPELLEIAKTYINPGAPKQHSKQQLVEIFKGKKNGKANK